MGLSVGHHCPLLVFLGTATAATFSVLWARGEKTPTLRDAVGDPRGADKPRVLQNFKGGHHVLWDHAARLFSLIQTWNCFLTLIAKAASYPTCPSVLRACCCTKTSMSHISRSAHDTLDMVLSSLLFTGRPLGGPGGSGRSWDLNLI